MMLMLLWSCLLVVSTHGAPLNVLFLVVDDLRSDLGCYNLAEYNISTPNLDKFAKSALLFKHAYVQQAVCGPSRNSFMTGRTPDSTKVWNFRDNFREKGVGANWVSFPQYFKEHGYETTGMGKLFHPGSPPKNDEPLSWSKTYQYYDPDAQIKGCETKDSHPVSCVRPNASCVDNNIVDLALKRLELLSASSAPFFFGVGLHRPHPDWNVPQEFFDMYPETLPLAPHKIAPTNMPPVAFYSCRYLQTHSDFVGHPILPDKPIDDALAMKVRRGYYAAVSYMDYQIGRVLDKLDDLGLSNSTVVTFHGDHGWALGDHGMWCKQANFEVHTNTPWIVRSPNKANSMGATTEALVELTDLYPTVAELAGLPVPTDLDGTSVAHLFDDPTLDGKVAAFSQFPRCADSGSFPVPWMDPCTQVKRAEFSHMGLTMRTDTFRFTDWYEWDGAKLAPDWAKLNGTELYVHTPGEHSFDTETENVAGEASYAQDVAKLRAQLLGHFKKNDSGTE